MTLPYVTINQARTAIGLPPLDGIAGLQVIDAKLLPERTAPQRQRGIYVPASEAQALIELCGWQLLDDCPGIDECLLLPPGEQRECVA